MCMCVWGWKGEWEGEPVCCHGVRLCKSPQRMRVVGTALSMLLCTSLLLTIHRPTNARFRSTDVQVSGHGILQLSNVSQWAGCVQLRSPMMPPRWHQWQWHHPGHHRAPPSSTSTLPHHSPSPLSFTTLPHHSPSPLSLTTHRTLYTTTETGTFCEHGAPFVLYMYLLLLLLSRFGWHGSPVTGTGATPRSRTTVCRLLQAPSALAPWRRRTWWAAATPCSS